MPSAQESPQVSGTATAGLLNHQISCLPQRVGAFVEIEPQRANTMMETARNVDRTNDIAGLEELASSFYELADRLMPNETHEALAEAVYQHQAACDGRKVMVGGTPVSLEVAVKQQITRFI